MNSIVRSQPSWNFVRTLCLAVPILLLTGCFEETGTLQGRVVRVSDGDTVAVLDSAHREHKIRLAGVDAPEKTQAFGTRSKESLSALIYDHQVSVILGKTDRYGRTIGKIMLDGADVNIEQIKAGYAWHYKKYQNEQPPEDKTSYARAEEEARANKLGLWADPSPTPPWEFRHEAKEK